MAVLDIQIDPSSARRGAGIIADQLQNVTKAAGVASLAGINMGRSWVGALGAAQLAFGVLSGPLRALTIAAGLLVGNLVVDHVLAQWQELAGAMGDLAAITGAVGADLAFLTTQARDFGSASIFASSQAAEALKLVASARPALLENFGGLVEVTDQVLLLARAAGISLADAASTAGTAMNQFSLDSSRAAEVVNVLAAGAKFGSSEIVDTAAALSEAGVVASRANVSFEELNAAIQLLAAGGITGGRAGNQLKNVILGLQLSVDQFNPSAIGLEQAIRNVADASLSTTDQLGLVGREGITTLQILTSAADEFGDLTSRITGTNTALEQAELRFDNLEGDVQRLDTATAALNETLGGFLAPFDRALTQARTAVVGFINDLLRLDDSIPQRASVRAEQLVGAGPGVEDPTAVSNQLEDVADSAVSAVTGLGTAFGDFFDDAVIGAERLLVLGANAITQQQAARRARLAEARGEHALARQILEIAAQEVDHRKALFNTTLSLVAAERQRRDQDPVDRGQLEAADATLIALNNEVAAERERQRLLDQRRDTIAQALDPLRTITAAPLSEQLSAASTILEGMRTSTEQLEIDLQRIQALGDLGLFSPDVEQNAQRTQAALDAVTARYEEAIERQRAVEEAEIERQQRAAQRRIEILEREQAQRQAIADRLVDQFLPLEAADRRRAESLEAASAAQRQGLLTAAQYAGVIAGISQRHQEEADRLNGVTAAMRTRQSVIDRYLRGRAALQRYQQALTDINKANLNSVDTERAKSAALREYRSTLESLNAPQQRLIEEQRRIAEEGARRFEQFSSDVSTALASFITGTEDSISNFFRNFAQQLLQAQIQASVVQPLLTSIVGSIGGSGGILGTLLGPILGQLGAPAAPTAGNPAALRSARSPRRPIPPGGVPVSAGSFGQRADPSSEAPVDFLSAPQDSVQTQTLDGAFRTPAQPAQVTVNNYGPADSVGVQTSTGPSGEQVIDITVSDSLRRQSSTGELDRTMGFYGGRRGLIPAG